MVLIRGAQIIDGTGSPARTGDVLIRGERISAIGTFPRQAADTVIDATGSVMVPGFIDVNTDSDHYLTLFTDPGQGSFLLGGITTAIGGNCGSSLAPLLYGSLESIRKWTDINQVNVGWHQVKEFLKVLDEQGVGVNFGTLIGHSTIRRALIGDLPRELTDGERKVFIATLREAFEDGALGFSTGLGYVHANATPYHEIKEFLGVVKRYHGIYTTHLRNEEENLRGSVDEAIRLVRESEVKGIISHFRPLLRFEREFGKALEAIENAGKLLDLHFDSYPFNTSFVALYTLLPRWARSGGIEAMTAHLERPGIHEQIARELPKFGESDITIVEAPRAPEMNGKTIGEIAANHGISVRDALLEVMRVTKLHATVLYRNVNEDIALQSLLSPNAFVSSNAPSVHNTPWFKHERFHNTFTKFIRFIRETKILPLEKAIQKITSAPAQKFSLRDRGEIKEGKFADIVLLKDNAITDVFVNGGAAVRFGKLVDARNGKVLRRS